MSEKNNGDESPLRPVESTDDPGAAEAGTDWMDALGVGWSSGDEDPDPAPAPDESGPDADDEDWMAHLAGSDSPEPPEREEVAAATESQGELPAWMRLGKSDVRSRRRDWVIPAAGLGALVVLVAGVGLLVLARMSGGDSEPTNIASDLAEIEAESSSSASASPSTAAAAFDCRESDSDSGEKVTGSRSGDTKSVAGVIFAFEHAYYSDRDAEKALDLTSDDSPLVNADALQEGIDSVPTETEHCVSITPDGSKARVEITEARPSQAPSTVVQEITTSRDGDRVEIVDITEEEN